MIDHVKVSDSTATSPVTMNALGRLAATNELSCRLAHQTTRRFSCNNPLDRVGINENYQPTATATTAAAASIGKQRASVGGNLNANIIVGSETSLLFAKQRKSVSAIVNKRQQLSTISLNNDLQSSTNKSQGTTPFTNKLTLQSLAPSVRAYVEDKAQLTKCQNIHICDGSQQEKEWLYRQMASQNIITPLRKYENCWLARTDPRDVARVESKTFICTRNKHDVVPKGIATTTGGGAALGNWMHLDELDARVSKLIDGCMVGRTMYVIPFSMGPIGSNLSKVGIELTDSPYVVASMYVMTRVSSKVLDLIEEQAQIKGNEASSSNQSDDDYVRCFHSVGCPLPLTKPLFNNWPCNPEDTIISHIPERKEIISYGSGYGGNSLLGKKCFALRLGSILGRNEGWLAEHMLILGITNPAGQKKYIAAAFPSACGKTNLAMMTPTLPGYKIECVGDDIAWMRFDREGVLRAINPEAGFFGVAPGTNELSNPNALKTIQKDTIFTNVAETSDGDFFWEGLEHKLKPGASVRDWQNNEWSLEAADKTAAKRPPAAHPNSRFCAPASQCPIIDPLWESAEGVPISAIIFGGRRPEGVPLVYESFNWNHGVYVGASMRSESTAAAEHKAKVIMHDPFAMRPFFGYNFGHYLEHWLSFGQNPALKVPKIFHVNWFRKSATSGKFLWPGFGENSRVLDWICRRVDGEQCATTTPIGLIPSEGALNLEGLKITSEKTPLEKGELFSISKDFWLKEQRVVENYLKDNVGDDLPLAIVDQSNGLKRRLIDYQEKN